MIGTDTIGAAHDVDGVDIELRSDACRRLVLGEGDHANLRDQIDHRVGIAHGRRVRMFAGLVVGRIVFAIIFDQAVQCCAIGIMRNDQRADLGAQEMIRA